MKKAQIEIIGLLLIVIFLSVLAVVFLRLVLRPGSEAVTEARQSIIAETTIDSLIKTSYNEKTFENLIYDCYTGSCDTLEQEINQIMPKLMPKKTFYMTFSSDDEVFLEIGQNCLGIQAFKVYIIESIPTGISLKLC